MSPVFVTKKARTEADDIAFHISLDNPRAANRFLDAVDETFAHLSHIPEAGTLIEELADTRFHNVRSCTINKFRNHLVLYRLSNNDIQILHIVDGRREYLELFEFDNND